MLSTSPSRRIIITDWQIILSMGRVVQMIFHRLPTLMLILASLIAGTITAYAYQDQGCAQAQANQTRQTTQFSGTGLEGHLF